MVSGGPVGYYIVFLYNRKDNYALYDNVTGCINIRAYCLNDWCFKIVTLSTGTNMDGVQPACVPACLRACVPACLRACVPACMPACLHACMPACLHACTCCVCLCTPRPAPPRPAPPRPAPHRTAPHRTAPHRTAPHRTAPHRTAPHRTAPQYTVLLIYLLSYLCNQQSLWQFK